MLVTSMSEKGFKEYGDKCLHSLAEHSTYPIIVYYEKDPFFQHPNIIYRHLYEVPGAKETLEMIGNSKEIVRGIRDSVNGKVYDYRYDAFKFCRKVIAIYDAMVLKNTNNEIMAWVDADVMATNEIPHNFLNELLPDDKYVAYLGREGMHSECGFMVFDTKHPCHEIFMPLYYNVYRTGAFTHFTEWHDSFIFDAIRRISNAPGVSLTNGGEPLHPFDNSVLGKYMHHLKGPERKKLGRSPERGVTHA